MGKPGRRDRKLRSLPKQTETQQEGLARQRVNMVIQVYPLHQEKVDRMIFKHRHETGETLSRSEMVCLLIDRGWPD